MTFPRANIAAIYPLSPVQEGILFHVLYAPDIPLYVQQYATRLGGRLDIDRLRASWDFVIARHEALRALITWEGRKQPLQIVRTRVEPEWLTEDWRAESSESQQERLNTFLDADRRRGFVLDEAPIMRFAIFRLADDVHQFVWSHHHIIIDGWSMGIVLDEVFQCYQALRRGEPPDLPPAPSYGTYVRWLHERDAGEAPDYWRRELSGFTSATSLRIEQPGAEGSPWAEHHAEEVVVVPAETTAQLRSFGREHGLTLSTMLRGAWGILLHRYSGDADVVFGATVSGRPPELEAAIEMVGLLINTLPVRLRIDADRPLVDWFHSIQRQQMDIAQYEATPLVDVQGWSDVPKGEPLFQTLLVFENVPHPATKAGDITSSGTRYLQRSNYPLAILVMPRAELELIVLYDEQRYEPALIKRMARQLAWTLEEIATHRVTRLGDFSLFPPGELSEIAVDWNRTAAPYPAERTIHSMIEEAGRSAPSLPAVVAGASSMTYGELDQRAADLAEELRAAGIGVDQRVALLTERSAAMVVAILAVLKAGGAYVPIDPRQPPARVAYLLDDIAPAAIIVGPGVDEATLPRMKGAVPALTLDESGNRTGRAPTVAEASQSATRPASADDLAYVIYTSGSTGRPKGVAVSHRALVNSTHARLLEYGDPVGTFLLLSPFVFDSSLAGIFSTLTQGGTLVLPAPDMEKDVHHLAGLIAEHGVTHTLALPTVHGLLLELAPPDALRSLRLVMVAGEACPPSVVERHFARLPHTRLVNEYGPTEATVWATVHHLQSAEPSRSGRVPIGKPIANTQAFILDPDLRPAPVGVRGELHISGLGLAQGYLNDPELTDARFINHDVGTGRIRLYRTGDAARYLSDGSIDLIGRIDHQVKIRGQRVELGEVETVIREHPAVHDAVVVLRVPEADAGAAPATTLIAYVEAELDDQSIRRFVVDRLPDVMVPSVFVTLAALPRGPTGKVDREALPDPVDMPVETMRTAEAPEGSIAAALAQIWASVLGLESVNADDNFFDLGGDSILSIRIIARAHEAGLAITPRQFFEHPTVAALAAMVGSAEDRQE